MKVSHFLLALCVIFLWGMNFSFMKMGLSQMDPFILTALRFLFAAVPAVFFIKRPQVSFSIIALYGLVFGVGLWGMMTLAINAGVSAGMASLLLQSSAFISVIIGVIFFKEVVGVDISEYALSQALPEVKQKLQLGSATDLPFEDQSFDLVLAINTLSELPIKDVRQSLRELSRVSKGRSFITLNSWQNAHQKKQLLKWNLTALSNYSVEEWKRVMVEEEYEGDYHWFFAD